MIAALMGGDLRPRAGGWYRRQQGSGIRETMCLFFASIYSARREKIGKKSSIEV